MPRLDESEELLVNVSQDVGRRAKNLWQGFKDFALQDNVLEVAVGLM